MAAEAKRSRRRGALRTLLALALLCSFVLVATSAFRLGMMAGLAAAGAGLIVYSVPATIFDWPRLTLEDVIDFFAAILSAIGSFFASLFDW